jgi:hypothetical protein
MFTITKQQRIKRLLIKLTADSKQLSSNLLRYLEETNDPTKLQVLTEESYYLKQEEIALAFDSLKYTYNDFCTIDSPTSWKLEKPLLSTGFIATCDSRYTDHIKCILPYLTYNTVNTYSSLVGFMQKALITRDSVAATSYMLKHYNVNLAGVNKLNRIQMYNVAKAVKDFKGYTCGTFLYISYSITKNS